MDKVIHNANSEISNLHKKISGQSTSLNTAHETIVDAPAA